MEWDFVLEEDVGCSSGKGIGRDGGVVCAFEEDCGMKTTDRP